MNNEMFAHCFSEMVNSRLVFESEKKTDTNTTGCDGFFQFQLVYITGFMVFAVLNIWIICVRFI